MTDPIQVLREMGPTHMYRSPEHVERWDGALAQVEALVEAADLLVRRDTFDMRIVAIREHNLIDALAPFKENP